MKQIIALSIVAGTLAATTAFGQGFLVIQSGRSATTDNFTTPGSTAFDTKVDVALFVSSSSTATPTVEALLSGTPSSGTANFSQSTAWNDIINDPNFVEAIDGSATPGAKIEMPSSTRGATAYNSGFGFALQIGATPTTAGQSVSLYEVSWDAALYSTLAAAEAAASSGNDPIGWSQVLNNQVLTASTSNTPLTPTFTSFGTFAATPEPGTLALAGLGGLSLLAFRRKK